MKVTLVGLAIVLGMFLLLSGCATKARYDNTKFKYKEPKHIGEPEPACIWKLEGGGFSLDPCPEKERFPFRPTTGQVYMDGLGNEWRYDGEVWLPPEPAKHPAKAKRPAYNGPIMGGGDDHMPMRGGSPCFTALPYGTYHCGEPPK